MRTGTYLCSILVLVVASTSYAQTDLLPELGLSDSAAAQIKQAAPRMADGSSDKVDHLEQAADHLEAAGLNDEAQRLRSQATLLRNQRQLKEKLKALHELQHEIRELYRLTGVGQQIQVDVKLIEFDLEKLETDGVKLCEFNVEAPKCDTCKSGVCSKGADIDQAASACKQEAPEKLFDEHGQFSTTGQRLRKAGVLKVIAEPSLITTPGRPANLLTGGEIPILVPQQAGKTNIEWLEFGTRVETVTAVMPDGRIRLELQVEVSNPDFNNAVNLDGNVVPGLTSRRINTHVLAESGETTLIGGQGSLQTQEKSKDGQICKKCLTVAVTPTLLSAPPVNTGKGKGDKSN